MRTGQVGGLLELRTLTLGANALNGSLPWQLGLMVNLTDLDAQNNRLEGREFRFRDAVRTSSLVLAKLGGSFVKHTATAFTPV